jgi:hypothetical protein
MRFIATEPENAQIPRAMARFDLESDEAVARRLTLLRGPQAGYEPATVCRMAGDNLPTMEQRRERNATQPYLGSRPLSQDRRPEAGMAPGADSTRMNLELAQRLSEAEEKARTG